MATKAEIIEELRAHGLPAPQHETKEELEARLQDYAVGPVESSAPVVARSKQSRGSLRRLVKAQEEFAAACNQFITEADRLVHEVDAQGRRSGEWDLVSDVKAMKRRVVGEVNAMVHPKE